MRAIHKTVECNRRAMQNVCSPKECFILLFSDIISAYYAHSFFYFMNLLYVFQWKLVCHGSTLPNTIASFLFGNFITFIQLVGICRWKTSQFHFNKNSLHRFFAMSSLIVIIITISQFDGVLVVCSSLAAIVIFTSDSSLYDNKVLHLWK